MSPPNVPPRTPKSLARHPSEHRFLKRKAVINGVFVQTYSCPCGGFTDDGLVADSRPPFLRTKRITEAEAKRRYQRHLEL